MSLKQSIVIVNEFTVKTGEGKGSRGGTPGKYILDYMSRGDATESCAPVRYYNSDDFMTKYLIREGIAGRSEDILRLDSEIKSSELDAGVAFGYGKPSLSREDLHKASKDVQAQFDAGKTVMKTVISFSEDYLKSCGAVPDDFTFRRRGDYRGKIDQMKIRMAVMRGLDKLSKSYSDLQYVGALQVDTSHVHCHLAMVDRGEGRVLANKQQRGKLTARDKEILRHGIDNYMNENSMSRHLSAGVAHDKRNVKCFMKKEIHAQLERNGELQFLIACLPEDRNLWRAGTNRKIMQKPNALAREYVLSILSQDGSGYQEALREIDAYARSRQEREGLDDAGYRRLCQNGRNAVVDDCVNILYREIRQMPREKLNTRTEMLARMSADYEIMASQAGHDDISEFCFKLRSYSGRLDYHKKEAAKYHEAVQDYRSQEISGPAQSVVDFMAFEEQYNLMLAAKYRHFLSFLSGNGEYDDEISELKARQEAYRKYVSMQSDSEILSLDADAAEDRGFEKYGISGGRYAGRDANITAQRMAYLSDRYETYREDLNFELGLSGLGLFDAGPGGDIQIRRHEPFDFDSVKALDLHHMDYDFPYDVEISNFNIANFIEASNRRIELYSAAEDYLMRSGQADRVAQLPGADIRKMHEKAIELYNNPGRLVSAAARVDLDNQARHEHETVSLDVDYRKSINAAILDGIQGSYGFSQGGLG